MLKALWVKGDVLVFYPAPRDSSVTSQLQDLCGSKVHVATGAIAPSEYHALIEGRPTAELLNHAALQTVIVPFAGVPEATLALLKDRPHLTAYNLHHNAADTAETAIALMLAAAKDVPRQDQLLRKNDWSPRYEPSRSIGVRGKAGLVLGYGAIGKLIARGCLGLGMQVSAVRNSVHEQEQDGEVQVFPSARLHYLLPKADVLLLALPRTPVTEGLIGKDELDLLPAHAILVNIARAQIVDETALYEALKTKRIHAAGLDVWYRYPTGSSSNVPGYFEMPESALDTPPSELPFNELDNVVMTPHRAGTSVETEERRARALADLLLDIAGGNPKRKPIDVRLGY